VRDRCREELKDAADDPDLPSVFDYMINLGVGHNSYIDDLLEFGTAFVDPNRRQLRLSAFTTPSEINPELALVKTALIKRAWRTKPTFGFCPNPEADWKRIPVDQLKAVEQLLRFFHLECREYVDKLTPVAARIKYLGNVDVAVCQAFWDAKDHKLKNSHIQVKQFMIQSVKKYVTQLELKGDDLISAENGWIDFKDATPVLPEKDETAAVAGSSNDYNPVVIAFDTMTGVPINSQVEFDAEATQAPRQWCTVPMQAWHESIATTDQGLLEGDMAATTALLNTIFEVYNHEDQKVEILQSVKRKVDDRAMDNKVVAIDKAERHAIRLPPCIPKQSKVFKTSDHPCKVTVTLSVLHPTLASVQPPLESSKIRRTRKFFLHPEFKTPQQCAGDERTRAAVAELTTQAASFAAPSSGDLAAASPWSQSQPATPFDAPPITEPAKEGAPAAVPAWLTPHVKVEPRIEWKWSHDRLAETMNPFWGVRRLTTQQLTAHNERLKKIGEPSIRFNCELIMETISATVVGSCAERPINNTRILEVPFLTNKFSLKKKEELVLELVLKKKTKEAPQKRSWMDMQREELNKLAPKKKAKQTDD
jgi:hypothetical protein